MTKQLKQYSTAVCLSIFQISLRTVFCAKFTNYWKTQQSFDKNILVQVISLNIWFLTKIFNVVILLTVFNCRLLSFFSWHLNMLIFHPQNNTQMLKKHQLVKNCAAEATILSSKRKHFFGVDFTSNAFRNELLLCLCIKTFMFNCFQRLKVISLR